MMFRSLVILLAAATTASAQIPDPLGLGAPAQQSQAAPGLTPVRPPAGLREHPVRTPVPQGAIEFSAGVYPKDGQTALTWNMPGHRRFRPPLFPDAGWDSPMVGAQKNYPAYLGVYWKAPYLAPGPMDGYPGLEIKGWTMPPPYRADVARSQAKPDEEAVFERRMAFIAEKVMASAPFQAPYGASIEPKLLLTGYGQQYGDKAAALMRGEIVFRVNIIQPNTGSNERVGDAVRSLTEAAWVKVVLNPGHQATCIGPYNRSAGAVQCAQSKSGTYWLGQRSPLTSAGADLLSPAAGFYADGKRPADLRMIAVQYGGGSYMSSELDRGRLHPHDPYGRAIGAVLAIDWPAVLAQAAAIS